MPVTKTLTLYKFDELSEVAQEKAMEKLWDINVDYDWWDCTYEDAANIGLEIQEFDLYRKSIDGKLKVSLIECCRDIRKNHGKTCDTFKTARQYLQEYAEEFAQWRSAVLTEEEREEMKHFSPKDWLNEFEWSEYADQITDQFRKALLEDYLSMLGREYDYLTSPEAIKNTIEANEYLFLPEGTLYSY